MQPDFTSQLGVWHHGSYAYWVIEWLCNQLTDPLIPCRGLSRIDTFPVHCIFPSLEVLGEQCITVHVHIEFISKQENAFQQYHFNPQCAIIEPCIWIPWAEPSSPSLTYNWVHTSPIEYEHGLKTVKKNIKNVIQSTIVCKLYI